MNKHEIAAFFDRMAPSWDARMVIDDEKVDRILTTAGIVPGVTVLDVACGTGVLFPYYLRRGAARVIGVDLSPEMARIAATKLHDPRIEVFCADVEQLPVHLQCEAVVIYNAFPHFPEPEQLLRSLTRWLRPGGRLTVAPGMGIEQLNAHHSGAAHAVSRRMLPARDLAALMSAWFVVDTVVSEPEIYLVSGALRA